MRKLVLFLMILSAAANAETLIRVNQRDQTFSFERDGKLIRLGRVTVGTKSHPTPNGSFHVLRKNENAYSIKYSAEMKNALFFIGTRYAIHAGQILNRRASHGCVRVSLDDSRFLFQNASEGT